MKKRMFKFTAALTALITAFSFSVVSVSADEIQNSVSETDSISFDSTAFLLANGYTEQQIQTLQTLSVSADHYIAYYNLTDNTSYLDDFIWHIGFVTAVASWASTMNYDGYVLNDDLVSINNNITPSGTTYQHNERMGFEFSINHLPDFMNLLRYKFHGSGNISAYALNIANLDDTGTGNVNDYITSGYVEAGNVTKYVSGSTDTDSTISYSDYNRVMQHFALLNVEAEDPTWTDAADIAADVNFDGVVNATDALAILNLVNDNIAFW